MEQTPEEIKKAALDNIEKVAKDAATQVVESVNKSVDDLKEELTNKSKDLDDKIGQVSAKLKEVSQTKSIKVTGDVPLESVIKHAITANSEEVKRNASGDVVKKSINLEEVKKDITDASFVGNALVNVTQRVRQGVYTNAYAPVWLRNLFPNVNTEGGSVVMPQVQEYTGGVAVWERGTGEDGSDAAKPDVNVVFKDVTITPKWIAGKMRVNRELLLNVPYLASSIPNTLLYSPVGLYAAENKMIIDYLNANSVAYSGDKTIGVEKLVDAALGQMMSNYLQADYVFLNNNDYVTYVALNKADGSGEYDLPNGLQVSIIDGSLFINQLRAIPVPSIPQGTAYVIASNEFEFVTRLGAELRMFEQSQNDAEVNKVLFRIEELAAFWVKDVNASVKVDLTA